MLGRHPLALGAVNIVGGIDTMGQQVGIELQHGKPPDREAIINALYVHG